MQECTDRRAWPLYVVAHGIIVPLLNTAEDARSIVRSAKFPPAGQRGFGSPFAMERIGGVTQTEYLQQANDSLLTIVQIETKDALHNVSAVHNLKGVWLSILTIH